MNFTKKIGRARQWAGEKFGAEAKTSQTDEFRMMEAETNLRHEGTWLIPYFRRQPGA